MENEPIERAQKVLKDLQSSETRGVKGVRIIKSGKPGPKLYVGIGTHGDEWVAAGALEPLLSDQNKVELISGEVHLVVNNLLGTEQGQRAVAGDFNFNRLPDDILDPAHRDSQRYSVQRIREIEKAGLFDVTHGLNFHTMTADGPPMMLHIKGPEEFANTMPIKDYVTHITDVQTDLKGDRTLSFGNLIGGIDKQIPVVEVEGGGPDNSPKIIQGVASGLYSTLGKLGMIPPELLKYVEGDQTSYKVNGTLWAPEGYRTRKLRQYERIKKGQILADPPPGKGQPIRANHDGVVIFGVDEETVKAEGYDWFTANNPEERRIQQIVPKIYI